MDFFVCFRRYKNEIIHVQFARGILSNWLDMVHNRTRNESARLGKHNFIRIVCADACRFGRPLPRFAIIECSLLLVSPLTVIGSVSLCLTGTTPPLYHRPPAYITDSFQHNIPHEVACFPKKYFKNLLTFMRIMRII
nr:MAG TPA: hypothetical protein [Caudoviricetes sp.]